MSEYDFGVPMDVGPNYEHVPSDEFAEGLDFGTEEEYPYELGGYDADPAAPTLSEVDRLRGVVSGVQAGLANQYSVVEQQIADVRAQAEAERQEAEQVAAIQSALDTATYEVGKRDFNRLQDAAVGLAMSTGDPLTPENAATKLPVSFRAMREVDRVGRVTQFKNAFRESARNAGVQMGDEAYEITERGRAVGIKPAYVGIDDAALERIATPKVPRDEGVAAFRLAFRQATNQTDEVGTLALSKSVAQGEQSARDYNTKEAAMNRNAAARAAQDHAGRTGDWSGISGNDRAEAANQAINNHIGNSLIVD